VEEGKIWLLSICSYTNSNNEIQLTRRNEPYAVMPDHGEGREVKRRKKRQVDRSPNR
jgi:hypothetical protein